MTLPNVTVVRRGLVGIVLSMPVEPFFSLDFSSTFPSWARLSPVMIVPSFVCGIPIAKGMFNARRNCFSTFALFFVLTVLNHLINHTSTRLPVQDRDMACPQLITHPRQINTPALRTVNLHPPWSETQDGVTHPIPHRNDNGIKIPVVHGGRTCQSIMISILSIIREERHTQTPHASTA